MFQLLPAHALTVLDVDWLSLERFVLQVFTEMHSMPNVEQALEQDQEGEDSAEESGEWESPK